MSKRFFAIALEVLAVAAIAGVGAWLRFSGLDVAPPGLYHDEAIYGILGAYVQHGNRDLFFGEREGLYMYLLAQGMITWGHGVLTLRSVSALVGTATIPALYILARLMYNRRVATFAAIGLAAAYWHVSLSRLAFRATTLPLFETLALALLWGALRARRRWPRVLLFTAAGIALGLTLYTYIASRMVPAVVLVFLVTQLVLDRRPLRPAWLHLPLYAGGTALVFWPLAAFFIANPTVFLGRMEEVSVAETSSGLNLYLQNIVRVAGMFFVAGDQNWRHNLAGLPVFDPVFAAAFVTGVAVCLRGWRRGANLFLILWTGAMLVPTIAAVDAPHYLRADGALPALFLLAAVGFDAALVWVAARWAGRGWVRRLTRPTGTAALAALLLIVPAASTWYTYFNLWLPRAETYYAFDGPLASAGDYLANSPAWRESAAGRGDFFLTARFWQDRSTMMYYLWPYISGKDRDDLGNTRLGSRWLDETGALPLRSDGAHYLLADEQSWALAELRRIYGSDAVSVERASIYIPNLTPFVVASVPAREAISVTPAPLAVFGKAMALEEYRTEVREDGEVDVVTRWRLAEVPNAWKADGKVLDVFVHALDSDGSPLAVGDGLGYQPIDWRAGESFVLRQTLHLPPGTAPGTYRLVLGVTGPDGQRVAGTGTDTDRTVSLGRGVTVGPWRNGLPAETIDRPATLDVDGRFRLAGVGFPAGSAVTPGEALRLELYWQATADVGAAYDVTLSLVDGDGKETAVASGAITGGRYPTEAWRAGDIVRDARQLLVSARAAAGEHRLRLTVTSKATGARTAGAELGTITVREVPRAFTPPAFAQAVQAPNDFGGVATLLGYSVQPAQPRPGEKVTLTLYWQAQSESNVHLKVFTHVLGPKGVVAQSDAEPGEGARPLTSWVSGEVVTDAHAIALPSGLAAGEYALEVGMYDPDSGRRLDVRDAQGRTTGSRVLLTPLAVSR